MGEEYKYKTKCEDCGTEDVVTWDEPLPLETKIIYGICSGCDNAVSMIVVENPLIENNG